MFERLYFQDAYCQEFTATVLLVAHESTTRWRVVLDRTAFYPMGGGQATDQGTLSSGSWTGKVYQVLDKEGKAIHFVQAEKEPKKGMTVTGTIDWPRRYRHMRLHSAGHVIDFAMSMMKLSPQVLLPVKADHRKKPHIVYKGILSESIQEPLQQVVNQLVFEDRPFSTRTVEWTALHDETLYVQPGIPKDKPLRILCLEGIGCVPDGGTQVHSTGECGAIIISKIEELEGHTIISYKLSL